MPALKELPCGLPTLAELLLIRMLGLELRLLAALVKEGA